MGKALSNLLRLNSVEQQVGLQVMVKTRRKGLTQFEVPEKNVGILCTDAQVHVVCLMSVFF